MDSHSSEAKKLSKEQQDSLNKQLWDSLDDYAKVKLHLDQGADPCYVHNGLRWNKYSALAYVAYRIDDIAYSIELHPSSDAYISDFRKYCEIAKLLISKMPHPDFNQQVKFSSIKTLLAHLVVIAAKFRHWTRDIAIVAFWKYKPLISLVGYCLEKGANPNNPVSLLRITTSREDERLTELLLMKGANPLLQLSDADPYQKKSENLSLNNASFIDYVIELDWPNIALLAIEKGISYEQKIIHGKNAGKSIEEYLISQGYQRQLQRIKLEKEFEEKKRQEPISPEQARLNIRELFEAADEKSLPRLRILKEQKADFHVVDEKNGDSVLHRTASAGAGNDVLDFLIHDCACGIDKTNNRNETPLFQAVDKSHVQTATRLIQNGARLDLTFGDEKTTLLEHAFKKRLSKEMIEVLARPEPSRNIDQAIQGCRLPSLHLAAQTGHKQAIEFLIDIKKADVNAKDEKGNTALQYAARNNQEEAVETLLKKGARFEGECKEDKDLLEQKDVSIAVKSRLTNHVAALRIQKEKWQKQSIHLANVIFLALFTDVIKPKKDAEGQAPTISNVEKLFQIALSAGVPIIQVKDEKQFGTFIKHHLLTKSKLAADKVALKDWHGILEKDVKRHEPFKIDLQNAVQRFAVLETNEIVIENIANELALSTPVKEQGMSDYVLRLTKSVLTNDRRLKTVDIDEQSLRELLAAEIKFSLEEKIDKTQRDAIYELRLKTAVDKYLHQKNQLSPDEKLSYEIAQRLTQELRKECKEIKKEKVGMKSKKEGIARYLIKQILESYPEEEPISAFLKKNPEKVDNFCKILFEKLKKDGMKDFSIAIKAQRFYQNKLKVEIDNWLQSTNRMRNLSFSRADSSSRLFDHSKFDTNEEKLAYSTNQVIFIETFCKLLDDLYSKFNALDLKLVKRSDEKIDAVAKKVDEYHDKLPKVSFQGFEIPTGSIALFLKDVALYLKDQSIEKAANRMKRLFGGHTPVRRGQIMEIAAQSIVNRYQHQVERLTPDNARELALCAAYRAMEYITRCDENLVAKEPTLLSKLGARVSDFINGRRQAPKLATELEEPVIVLMNGVIEGRSEKDEAPLGTWDRKQWQPLHVFNNTGIIVKDENQQLQLYTHKRLNKNPDGSPMYGFRYGTKAEVEQEGYERDITTPLAVALQLPSSPNARLGHSS